MPTFKDLFPQEYENNTPFSEPELAQQAMAAQPPRDYTPNLPVPTAAPLLQPPDMMTAPAPSPRPSFRERFAAYNAGQNPYAVYRGLGQADTELGLRKQRLAQEQKQNEREALLHGMQLIQNGTRIKSKPGRKAYFNALRQQYKGLLGKDDPGFLAMFEKAADEEGEHFAGAWRQVIEANPQWGIKDVEAFLADPEAALQAATLAQKGSKERAEQAQAEGLARALSGPSQGPVGGTSPQPGTSGPAQPQAAPQGSQGPLSPIQQQVADEAVRQGVDPALALAIAENESSFRFVSGDGGKAAGYFQLHDAASQDAGKALDMDPNARHTPEGNIRLGVAYIKDTLRRAGGSPQGAMALYNWGTPSFQGKGNPRYVQDVTAGHQRYQRLLGGRPVTQATVDAGPEVTGRIGQLNQEIQALEQTAQRLLPYSRTEGGKRASDTVHKQIEQKQREVQRLHEAQNPKAVDEYAQAAGELGFPKNPGQRTQEQDFLVNQLVNKRKQEHTAAQGRDAADRTPLKNSHLWLGPDKQRVKGVTTQGQLIAEQERRAKAGEDPLVEWEKLDTEKGIGKEMPERRESIDAAERIQNHLSDPKLAELVGTLLSNPAADYRKKMAEIFGDEKKVPEKYWEVAAELALLTTKVRHQYFGTAQTAQELVNLRPLLGSMGTASAGQLKGQLKTLRNALARVYNAQLQGFDDNYVLAPKSWKPVEVADAGNPGEPTPAPVAADAAPKSLTVDSSRLKPEQPKVSPAMQQALDILNGVK